MELLCNQCNHQYTDTARTHVKNRQSHYLRLLGELVVEVLFIVKSFLILCHFGYHSDEQAGLCRVFLSLSSSIFLSRHSIAPPTAEPAIMVITIGDTYLFSVYAVSCDCVTHTRHSLNACNRQTMKQIAANCFFSIAAHKNKTNESDKIKPLLWQWHRAGLVVCHLYSNSKWNNGKKFKMVSRHKYAKNTILANRLRRM